VVLDGSPVEVAGVPAQSALEVLDDGDGFLIRLALDGGVSEVFENGAALLNGCLCPLSDDGLHADEWHAYKGYGRRFSRADAGEIVSVILPSLEARVEIVIRTSRLPKAVRTPPRIVIETRGDESGDLLTVIPHLVYGKPPVAEIRGANLRSLSVDVVPIRDRVEESRLVRELQTRLFLRLDEAKVYRGEDAIHCAKRLDSWEISGEGRAQFTPVTGLTPILVPNEGSVTLGFEVADGRRAVGEGVRAAFSQGGRFVRLDGGGWGELPVAWLAKHRDVASR
jgi:hypothetical protein